MTCEIMLTVAMGKRLIARGLMADARVADAMRNHKLLIIGGSTNGYVAEEALKALGDTRAFDKRGFRRGVTAAPGAHMQTKPCGFDMLIDKGSVRTDGDVFAFVNDLGEGDMIMKGANALYLPGGEAGVLIGHPQGGTVIPTIAAQIGRRVSVVVPVGLEKRVEEPIAALAAVANSAEADGPRLCPLPGRTFTELDAIAALTGAKAKLLAAGGVLGAEGCVWLAVSGTDEQIQTVRALHKELSDESATQL